MKKFFLRFFAFIGFLVFAFFIFAVVLTPFGSKSKTAALPGRMVLSLSLEETIPETPPHDPFSSVLNGGGMTVQDIVETLERARQDRRVVGLTARIASNELGLASVQELRNAINAFEKSGKFAYVYIDDLSDKAAMGEYWLASSFDQIWLNPVGTLALTGFSVEIPFAKDFLDKIGIQPELLHQGKYKSFPESVMRSDISPENLEMTTDMINSLTTTFYSDVTKDRKLKPEKLDHIIDQALISSETALNEALIDSIGYRDEFDSYVETTTKGAAAVALDDYHAAGLRPVPGEKMALIYASGALTMDGNQDGLMTDNIASADSISDAIAEARDNKEIKAIIVHVDSPGGTPLAADTIRRAIQIAANNKPVVVSMSNYAASGGYWMSTSANAIIAQPTTLTGSIGVFGGKFNAEDLFNKMGIKWVTLSDNNNADMWSVSRPYSLESYQKIDTMMQSTYQQFIQRVASGRKISPEQVEKIAQGRVWTGAQAIKIGLVDRLGGMDTAIETAKSLAKIQSNTSVTLEVFPKPLNPVEQIFEMLRSGRFPSHLSGTIMHKVTQSFLITILGQTTVPTIH